MKYIDQDLDFIFIRARNKQGKWDAMSIRELDKIQWEDWLIRKWGDGKKFWKSINDKVEQEEWTDLDKLNILNWLSKRGAVIVMIKREARKKWNKK